MKMEATAKVMKEAQKQRELAAKRGKKARKRDAGETKALGAREKGGGLINKRLE